MELALALATWLSGRWWGKPFGWLIYGICFAAGAMLLIFCAALLLGLVGGIVYGLGSALLSTNPLSAGLFIATAAVAVVTARLWWSVDHEVAALPVGAVAVVIGVAWLVSLPGDPPPKPGTRAAFCSKHDCIGNWQSASGYRVHCSDGAWSFSGGRQGACSSHGGSGPHYFGTSGTPYGASP
jgi:hypothetical protein